MPDNKYTEHRTIWISKEDGIKAIYGKIKDSDNDWEIQSYLFMKSQGWDMEKSKEWFKEHKTSAAYSGPIALSAERDKSTFRHIWDQNDAKYPIKAKIIDKTRCKNDWGIKKEDYEEICEQVAGTPMKVNHNFGDVRSTVGQWYKGEVKEDGIWAYGMISDKQIGKLCHDLVLTNVSPTILPGDLLCSECLTAQVDHDDETWPCKGSYLLVTDPMLEEISIVDIGAYDDTMLAPYAFIASAAITPSTPDVQYDLHENPEDGNKFMNKDIIETPMEVKNKKTEEDSMTEEKKNDETSAEQSDIAKRFDQSLSQLENLLQKLSEKLTSKVEDKADEKQTAVEEYDVDEPQEEKKEERDDEDVSAEVDSREPVSPDTQTRQPTQQVVAENEKLKKEIEALKADGNGVSRYEGSDETESGDKKLLAELKNAFNE